MRPVFALVGVAVAGAATAATITVVDSTRDGAGQAVVWVTGDTCEAFRDPEGCDDVAALVRDDADAEALLLTGDAQYEDGSAEEYRSWYDELMAPGLLEITRPAIGNHDYRTADGSGYWDYFGERGGARGEGWYDFTVAGWRIVAVNSNCQEIGGCAEDTEQRRFLAEALAGPERCELVFAHHPAFSDGKHGDDQGGHALFTGTYDGGGDLYLAGHDHSYQRFAPMRPDGTEDAAEGVRSLVIGTGGANLYEWRDSDRSEYRQNTELGAVRLVLSPDGYRGEFHNTDGEVMDTFSGTCH